MRRSGSPSLDTFYSAARLMLNAPMSVVASTAIPAHSSRSKVLGQKAARLRKILILHSPGGDVGENYIKRSEFL